MVSPPKRNWSVFSDARDLNQPTDSSHGSSAFDAWVCTAAAVIMMVSHTPCSILFYGLSMPRPLNYIVLHRTTQNECKDTSKTVVLYVPCSQPYMCSCVRFVKKSNMFVSLCSTFHLTAPLCMLQHIAKFCREFNEMSTSMMCCNSASHHP